MLVHSCQPVTSFKRISLLIENFGHVPSTRISEWLPQIAHVNIFVLAHKHANEPAGVLSQWQNSGSSCVKCNTAFSYESENQRSVCDTGREETSLPEWDAVWFACCRLPLL
jgi:hypothetical protein